MWWFLEAWGSIQVSPEKLEASICRCIRSMHFLIPVHLQVCFPQDVHMVSVRLRDIQQVRDLYGSLRILLVSLD